MTHSEEHNPDECWNNENHHHHQHDFEDHDEGDAYDEAAEEEEHGGEDAGEGYEDEEEEEELHKDILDHIEEAETALENLVDDYTDERLKDPEVWSSVEGFMDRVVQYLAELEKLHESNRPSLADKLEGLEVDDDYDDGEGADYDEQGGH